MIFYFSGTGNSLYAARKITADIGEKLIDISEAMVGKRYIYSIAEDETVGFVFPVYYYGVPTIVRDFVSRLLLECSGTHCFFAVITCGGGIGGADRLFAKMLKAQNYDLKCTFELRMTDNFVLGYDLHNEVEQKIDLVHADQRIAEIVKSIQTRRGGGASSGIPGMLLTKAAYPFYLHGRKTRKFHADEKCNGCTRCKDLCPVEAIEMRNGKPFWAKDQCVHCLACINRCPKQAIQYGSQTKKRRRFQNPILKTGSASEAAKTSGLEA